MSIPMPIPSSLSIFVAVGNETAEAAGHIVSAIADHVQGNYRPAMACISLVDKTFDCEHALYDNLHYTYSDQLPMSDVATQVVRNVIQERMELLLDDDMIAIDFRRVSFILVVDAAGKHSLAELDKLRRCLTKMQQADGRYVNTLLCVLADNHKKAVQRCWLMDGDRLRPEIEYYKKILLLTPQRYDGVDTKHTARDVLDVVLPALLLIMQGHEMNSPARLYTASYDKSGGTSSDIAELRQHIAAEVLDSYFADSTMLTANEVWALLSTPEVNLRSGKTATERVMQAAAAHVPTLEHLVLTADLDNKNFDPVQHILAFDEMNCKAMCDPRDWPQRWLNSVKQKLLSEVERPDGYLEMLSEDAPITAEILRAYGDSLREYEKFADTQAVSRALESIDFDVRRGLLKSRRDHHLMLLNTAVDAYQDICRRRIAYCILISLQQGMKELRTCLENMRESRVQALKTYMMLEAKAKMLKDMCADAARDLEQSYSRSELVKQLPSYLQHRQELYREGGARFWHQIYTEFKNKGRRTGSFASAFLMGNDQLTLMNTIRNRLGRDSAMISSYPEEMGRMPEPCARVYLLNDSIAEKLETRIDNSNVFAVPGDLMEHISLYALSESLELMTALAMFQQGDDFPGFEEHQPPVINRRRTENISSEELSGNFHNPWHIATRMMNGTLMLSFDWPDREAHMTIRLNDETLENMYTYNRYLQNAHCYKIPESSLPSGNLVFTLTCGEKNYTHVFTRPLVSQTLIPTRGGHAKAVLNDLEFQRSFVSMPAIQPGKCLRLNTGATSFRMQIPWDANDNISPLWYRYKESGSEITIEDSV